MSRHRTLFFSLAACLLAVLVVPVRAQATDEDSHPTCQPYETSPFRNGVGDCPPQEDARFAIDPVQAPNWQAPSRPDSGRRYWKGVWIATWAAFVAVNVLDAHSSSGRLEGNPLLRDSRGIFSGRKALLVKSAAGGGFFALQGWLAHKHPGENHYKSFALATGAATAALGAVAVHNYGVQKAGASSPVPATPAYLLRQP